MADVRYFVRVTPANYLYALALSFRCPVAVWKVGVPLWLATRFRRVQPYRIFTRDEWLLAHDAALELWKGAAFPIVSRRHRPRMAVGGREVDFSHNLWQMLAIEIEALSLLTSMLKKTHGEAAPPCIVTPRVAGAFAAGELEVLFPQTRFAHSGLNRRLEGLHEWGISCAHLARTLFVAAASFFRRRLETGRRPVAWLGISPIEVPDRDARLNFAWACQYGFLSPRDVLYFLPDALSPAQRDYLRSRDITALEPGRIFAIFDARTRLAVAARSLAGFCAALAREGAAAPYLARFMARAPYWDALFKARGTRVYATTSSYAWPEKPELAVAAAAGVRSIIWAYSANSLTFSVAEPRYRDTGVLRSVPVAGEQWVWNEAYAQWLERRRVDDDPAPAMRIVGPLMCGDPRLLELDAREARARLGVPADGVCVGIFDMPPINDAWRDRFGGGPPMVDAEMYVAFWTLVERVIERVPGAIALIKMKRDFGHLYREFPPAVRAFLDENNAHVRTGRVRMIDVNVDPYLPIAASDVALGITYTSPILAACSIGRPAYWLDPLRRVGLPPAPGYGELTLTTEDEAVAAVLAAQRGAASRADASPAIPPAPVFPLRVAADGSVDAGPAVDAVERPLRAGAAASIAK